MNRGQWRLMSVRGIHDSHIRVANTWQNEVDRSFNAKVSANGADFARSRLLPPRVVRQTIRRENTRPNTRHAVAYTFSHDTISLITARLICNRESEFPVAKEIPRSACVASYALACYGITGWILASLRRSTESTPCIQGVREFTLPAKVFKPSCSLAWYCWNEN